MKRNKAVKIIECPRDAMQGLTKQIPTDDKVRYINSLLKVGFDTLDMASFVSPKAVPQMSDSREVLERISITNSETRLLAIIPNFKGAMDAIQFDAIKCLGFPFSISRTFLKNNLNTTIDEAHQRIQNILRLCKDNHKQLVVYISMAFGNPYGDYWDLSLLDYWVGKLQEDGICTIALSDTTGSGSLLEYKKTFETLVPKYPDMEFGLHLHTKGDEWLEKLETAYNAGCRRFDTVMNDKGGCHMSGKELVSNLNTHNLLRFLQYKGETFNLNMEALKEAQRIADEIFPVEQ